MSSSSHPPANSSSNSGSKSPTPGGSSGMTGNPVQGAALSSEDPNLPVADAAVLAYLKKKGLVSAVSELTKMLEQETNTPDAAGASAGINNNSHKPGMPSNNNSAHSEASSTTAVSSTKKLMDRLEESDDKRPRTLLTKSTGGSYGYDRDTACPVAAWGIPDAPVDKDAKMNQMGVQEAKMYLDAFCALQLWVLSLPDQEGPHPRMVNPMRKARAVVQQAQAASKQATPHQVLAAAMNHQQQEQQDTSNNQDVLDDDDKTWFDLPPSAKPELLAVTFCLLVHTYCELLEVGMESSAHTIRDAYKPVYEPLYPTEFRDLYHVTTTDDMMRLQSHSASHMDAASTLKSYLVQIASYQLHREETNLGSTAAPMGSYQETQQQAALKQQRIQEYDRQIGLLQKKYQDLQQRASASLDRMASTPFLRRARAARWQLYVSTTTYRLLSQFLSSDESLLSMSTLLQAKCELHVERRNPMPFLPACVLSDEAGGSLVSGTSKGGTDGASSLLGLHDQAILWAAPAPNTGKKKERLPLPKYEWDQEYETEEEAAKDKPLITFNRNLLVHGFRRLEALERKRTMEVLPEATRKRLKEHHGDLPVVRVNPLEPSVLLLTLCSSAASTGPLLLPRPLSGSKQQQHAGGGSGNANPNSSPFTDAAAIWEEAGLGLCCAQVCPPDGRRVAVGCDDAAVRIYHLQTAESSGTNILSNEPETVLLGHKNGFPVFSVSWNRDGRSLLTAGGDGSIRLWDTAAVGPFGQAESSSAAVTAGTEMVATLSEPKTTVTTTTTPASSKTAAAPGDQQSEASGLDIPGLKPEGTVPYKSGAALAVYRGHAPSCPVWSVAFSPAGYYFASTGADGTARLWTTDRPVPVRLFCGHTAANVNCVTWHPNGNFILTGSDDKTARLWDIQTGRTVRLLNGCPAGIHAVAIAPSGRYAAASDHFGIVHLWDLGNGKKVCEFRPQKMDPNNSMVHSLTFSACGSALAAGGDDCCVRVWDVREQALEKPIVTQPTRIFATRRTMLLDLHFNRRNLLLAVGKVVTPVPLVSDAGE